MKKFLSLLSINFLSFLCFAQLPVSHTAGKKQALIEDFTGNKCQGCPSGAKQADQIIAANPGKAFAICIHSSGSFSEPDTAASAKDFRTPDGDAIRNISGIGIVSYPSGMVNRVIPTYPQTTGGLAMYHGFWANETNAILLQNSYVNIAGQAYLHPTTRQMYVYIEAYYTSNCPVSTNKLNVALLQDNIIAYQKGAYNYPAMQVGNDYRHNHVLRDMITNSALGDNITGSKTAGTTYTRTISYNVHATYPDTGARKIPTVLADLQLLAWIAESDRNIIAVCKIPITITTSATIFENQDQLIDALVYPNPTNENTAVKLTLKESAEVSYNLYSNTGQLVLSEKAGLLNKGGHNLNLNTSEIPSGMYLLTINAGDAIITRKISVVK